MFNTKDFEEDKQSERKLYHSVVSLFSSVMVLLGIATLVVGDSPIVPYNKTETLSVDLSDVWMPLCMPTVGKIPMLMFLPNFGDRKKTDIPVEEIPENALPVVSLTLKPPASMDGAEGVYINNEAKKDIEIRKLLDYEDSVDLRADDSVQVLIYHTHGSEGYNNEGLSYYGDEFYDVHTDNMSENVVHIGQIVTEKLRAKGIGVVHDTVMYDLDGYNDAYSRSCSGALSFLKLYPNIKLVLDIHRDTIVLNDGSKYRPVTEYRNKEAAQMMILVGTGKASAPNDHWMENLSVAVKLQREAEKLCENIMRPILLRNSGYNQHISNGAILVEMGTCGNSLKEAELAAEVLSSAIIKAFVSE
ncbi:MAG: stage II sporulation protein P [Clostridia bacterium]|nr:stage II sporulation protein P [Clostridia bacterium]